MNCSNTSGCGYRLKKINEYVVEVDATPGPDLVLGDFWLYDSFNPEDILLDHMPIDALKYAWDSPNASIFVSCGSEECRTNFELQGDACFVSADFDIVEVTHG